MTNYAQTEYATAALLKAWVEAQATTVTFTITQYRDLNSTRFIVTVPATNKTA